MLFPNLTVVLCRPKLSENIGSVARICANMGCPNLSLAAPRDYKPDTARSLATGQGEDILNKLKVHADVHQALASMHRVYATTARTGGWRKRVLLPDEAAAQIVDELENGQRVALFFGPEHEFYDLWPLFESASFLVTGHYHYVIFGAMVGCPFIPMSANNHKMQGVCELLEWERTMPFDATYLKSCRKEILAEAGQIMTNRHKLSPHLIKKAEQLQTDALTLGDHIASLVKN